MRNKLSISIVLIILSNLSGCATRTIASQYLPKEAPLSQPLQVPAPDPLLFPKCLTELLAQTSAQGLTPSCQQLLDWQSSTQISSNASP